MKVRARALFVVCLTISPAWTPTPVDYVTFLPAPLTADVRRRMEKVWRIHGDEPGIPSRDGRTVQHAREVTPDSEPAGRERRTHDLFESAPAIWSVADEKADGTLLLTKLTSETGQEIYEFSPANELRPLFGVGEDDEWDARYGVRGEVIARGTLEGEHYRLWEWTDGVFTPLSPESPYDVASFKLLARGTRVVYTTNEGGFSRLHLVELETRLPVPVSELPRGVIELGNVSKDGADFVTFTLEGARYPGASYLLDGKTGKAGGSPGFPKRRTDLSSFTEAVLSEYPARDGATIPFILRRPQNCEHPESPCPVIVMFHGGPEDQATPNWCPRCEVLTRAGYIVLEPNIRGSGGYGHAWLHADDHEKRLAIVTDIADAAIYARRAFAVGGVAPRVGARGGSYGGYATLLGMSLFAGAYDAGVAVMGESEIASSIRESRIVRLAQNREYGDPDDEHDRALLHALSPLTYVDRIEAPLLLMHGADDLRVPVNQCLTMHEALARRGIDAPMVIFPHEGHGFSYEDTLIEEAQTLAFFDEHLKKKAPQ